MRIFILMMTLLLSMGVVLRRKLSPICRDGQWR